MPLLVEEDKIMFLGTATVSSPPMKTKESTSNSNNSNNNNVEYEGGIVFVVGEDHRWDWLGSGMTGGSEADPEESSSSSSVSSDDEPPVGAVEPIGQCSLATERRRRPLAEAEQRPSPNGPRSRRRRWRPSGGNVWGPLLHVLVFTVVFIDLFNSSASSSILRASSLDPEPAVAAVAEDTEPEIYGRGNPEHSW